MSRLRIAFPFAIGSLFAAMAQAQDAGIAVNTPLSPEMLSANITRMACVDLDQNLTKDAVFLVGHTPYASFEPDYWRQYVPLFTAGYSFDDVCAAPGLGFDGSDAVACVGASGLWLVSRQAASGTNQGALTAVRVDGATNLFVGCKRIVCDDIDSNGVHDLIGVTADGTALRRATRVGTAWVTAPVSGTFSTAIDDIEIVDWDGELPKDIAVLRLSSPGSTNGRCEVRSFNASLSSISSTFYWTMPGVGVAMAKTRHRGRAHDQIALVYRYGSPQFNWFTVCGSEAPTLPGETKPHEAGFSLGPVNTIELASGHIITGENEEDLYSPFDVVITQNYSPDQLLFANVSTTDSASASFSIAPGFLGLLPLANFTSPYTNFTSSAGIADFDGDGDGDILIPSRPSGNLSLFRNGLSRNESEYKIYFSGEGSLIEASNSEGNYHTLAIEMRMTPKLAGEVNRLIVMIYRQRAHGEGYDAIEETPITHAVTHAWFDTEALGPNGTMLLNLPIKEASTDTDNRYHILVRPMHFDAAEDAYKHAYPTTKYVLTFRNDDFGQIALENENYFTPIGGGGGGDIAVEEPTVSSDLLTPALWNPLDTWLATESEEGVVGGGTGGQTSGGSTTQPPKNPIKKGGTPTGGVVVVIVPDPFDTNTPPPRPRASTP